jgi:hypothetical protein
MKKRLLTTLFFVFSLNFYAQINYEKSYFIDNEGIKTECFIKNKDKNDNPTNFEYKLSPDDTQVSTADITTVKEFKIGTVLKFERATVNVDTSSVNLNTLNLNREPEWKKLTVFLKTLVDSETSLFEYKNGNMTRFFYRTGSNATEQLVYRKYIIDADLSTNLGVNNDFQKQLWQNVNCGNISIDNTLKLKYVRKDLIKYFVDYNACKNNAIVDFGNKLEKGSVNIKVLAGVTASTLSLSNSLVDINADFDSKMNVTFGAEFEWFLPINRNKWSLFLAPSYNSYENSTTVTINNTGPFSSDTVIQNWNASLSHLDLAVGFRYYMYLNANSKIFIGGSYIIANVLDSDIHNENRSYQTEAKFQGRIGYGIGYSFKNKFNIELKYSSTNIYDNYIYYDSKYSSTSLVLGYTIFDSKKKK